MADAQLMPDRIQLTTARVRALKPRSKNYVVHDREVRGLYVEIGRTGARYKIATTSKDRRTIRSTLGHVDHWSLEQARSWARDKLGKVRRNQPIEPPPRDVPTLEQALEDFLDRRDMQGKDKTASKNYRARFQLHLSKLLPMAVDAITTDDIAKIHKSLKKKSRTADLVVGSLAVVLNQKGVLRHLTGGNPCSGVDLYRAKPKDGRPLESADEVAEWWAASECIESTTRRNLLRLMLLTGLRGKSAKQTRLKYYDGLSLNYPAEAMKSGKAFRLPLNRWARAIIEAQLENAHDGWLFPASSASGHVEIVSHPAMKAWGGPHNLRRTFITLASKTSVPDLHRRLLVNHSTGGDAHAGYIGTGALFDEALTASETIGAAIMAKVPSSLVVPLR